MITYLRLRPTDTVTAVWAATRRREGTTALEIEGIDAASVAGALAGGILPVGSGIGEAEPAAWVVKPADALELARRGVRGFRVTVEYAGPEEAVLDAVARGRAVFLRAGRSRVAAAADLVSTPGLSTVVSVFVDSVEDAVAAVASGAGDLVLRDWDTESIGLLRDAMGGRLVERTALPIGVGIDDARNHLPDACYTAWLHLVDGMGAARPRYSWAPGRDEEAPSTGRLSAEWPDAGWRRSASPSMERLPPDLTAVLDRSLAGTAPTRDEVERLFMARGDEVDAVARVADDLRRRANGDRVTYVVNRNINYT
ncbi:MAG: hypothetical protein Q8Q29_00345, partial [Actinomycetota bacterium]|nr:hypothetical protein [Actinomycetota bacterium]